MDSLAHDNGGLTRQLSASKAEIKELKAKLAISVRCSTCYTCSRCAGSDFEADQPTTSRPDRRRPYETSDAIGRSERRQ